MFSELEQVMNHVTESKDYLTALISNVANKKTRSNINKTYKYLQQLYSFDLNNPAFWGFKYFRELPGIHHTEIQLNPNFERKALEIVFQQDKNQ